MSKLNLPSGPILAVALTFNLSDIIQRDIPNYTQAATNSLEKGASSANQGSAGAVSCRTVRPRPCTAAPGSSSAVPPPPSAASSSG